MQIGNVDVARAKPFRRQPARVWRAAMMEFIAATMRKEEALVTIADRGRTVTLKVKFFDFEIMSRSRSMPGAVATRDDLERISVGLLEATMPLQRAVRLLGVSLSSLQAGDHLETQFGLPI